MKILVTGCAGFIGYHLCLGLIKKKGFKLYGIDNINNYYDIKLKKDRIKDLNRQKRKFNFYKIDIKDSRSLESNFIENKYDVVINLAAQAGVRYSIEKPKSYFDSNLQGYFNILESCRKINIKHLIFASSSSVYGDKNKFPLIETDNTDKPLSFYAASKKCNEVMSYAYSSIYKLPCTGLRFFTVYGPFGRPDMALFKFIDSIDKEKSIDLFNNGSHVRDFTYIEDAVKSMILLIKKPPKKVIPFEIFNIASSNPIKLMDFLKIIENNLLKKAKVKFKALQKGDVYKTFGSTTKIFNFIKYKPRTDIKLGVSLFYRWYKKYNNKN